ncbi:hypothetical protein LCGC14_3124890, partial [marine sediment metagenome]
RCKRCSQGDKEPRPEIISKVEASKIPAMRVAGHLLMGLYVHRWKTGAEATQAALNSFLAE